MVTPVKRNGNKGVESEVLSILQLRISIPQHYFLFQEYMM